VEKRSIGCLIEISHFLAYRYHLLHEAMMCSRSEDARMQGGPLLQRTTELFCWWQVRWVVVRGNGCYHSLKLLAPVPPCLCLG